MHRSIRLTNDGRITIPKHLRERFDLRAGDRIEWIVEGDVVRLRRRPRIRAVMGTLARPDGLTFDEMMERADAEKTDCYAAMYIEESHQRQSRCGDPSPCRAAASRSCVRLARLAAEPSRTSGRHPGYGLHLEG